MAEVEFDTLPGFHACGSIQRNHENHRPLPGPVDSNACCGQLRRGLPMWASLGARGPYGRMGEAVPGFRAVTIDPASVYLLGIERPPHT